uniref:Uncharacterized protein n=1 Tax=Chromera velia CCMP2878 TaxID=1169474 RepID=A0A0G4G3U5_9ALVE|eukprot:Cvel_20162.t1-p1 / transcript=Cvel_20162.t1 / gene=Cvel_20162 / organism=Chromera_velia_CCMP2878 / gene_product=hypothetical protein / transcript_product=hypothetical protein / location=Cvel_scaffold1790:35405-37504(-) / protein_length=81 / sequence_SO=supercontig / SO=protein_coding / is_pseudo=false
MSINSCVPSEMEIRSVQQLKSDMGTVDTDALEALWVLWVSPLPLAARELMGALDGGLSGISRLCVCICVEPDGMPAGVSLR